MAETTTETSANLAQEKKWQFAFFGTSTANVCNAIAEGSSLENRVSLTSCTVKEDGNIEKREGSLLREKDMMAFPFTIQIFSLIRKTLY